MKITKKLLLIGCTSVCGLTANGAVLIDSTFANGNGSFEFDATGAQLTANGAPGLWGTSNDTVLTIDGNDMISPVQVVTSRGVTSSAGNFSLEVSPDRNLEATNSGGFLNVGHVVGSSDQFSLSFDWIKTENRLGAASFEVFVFTSSDNTLGGTLTSLFKQTIGSGPATPSFLNVSLGASDFTIAPENEGQELWVAFAPGGFSGASNASRLNIDNINLSVIPEPSSSALLAMSLGGMVFLRRRKA